MGTAGGIGKITPTGTVTIFNTPGPPGSGSAPWGLAVGPDDRIWYVDRNEDWIGAFSTSATSAADVTTYPTNHANAGLLYITKGSDGRMWFNEFNRNALGAITTGGSPPPPPPESFKLTLSKGGNGSGTVTSSPSGIDCGPTCAADFSPGTQVTLTPTGTSGSTFGGWSGGGCSGSGNCTVTMNADTAVTAIFDPAQSGTTTTPPPTTTSPPRPIAGIPVNVVKPFIAFNPSTDSFVRDPGRWQNVSSGAFGYEWLRRTSGSTVSVVARTQTFRPGRSAAHNTFGCQVDVPAFTGSTIPTPHFTPLSPVTVPISAYGNFRIRGIDVFQVVQPNPCAAMFSFPTGGFPCLSGGGTPTSYGPSGKLAAGADPQRTNYVEYRSSWLLTPIQLVYGHTDIRSPPGNSWQAPDRTWPEGLMLAACSGHCRAVRMTRMFSCSRCTRWHPVEPEAVIRAQAIRGMAHADSSLSAGAD